MRLSPFYLWLFLLNAMSVVPWSYGPLTFICLIASVVLLGKQIGKQIYSPNKFPFADEKKQLQILLCLTLFINLITTIGGLVFNPKWIIDIAQNTYAATDAFAQGKNPYTHTAQLWVKEFPTNTSNIETINGQVTMFGVPYFHGYPYFPLMLLSYLPLYYLIEGYTAIRVTHIILLSLNVWALTCLCDRLIPNKETRQTALMITLIAYLAVFRYNIEVIALGVTDILISTYLLFCFVALSRQWFLLAGILLGCAQACKLLPAPFVLLGILFFLYGKREIWIFIAGFITSCAVLILPFFLWHPEGFISATILYYLTHHGNGDDTSLWFYLPSFLQPMFIILGLILTLLSIMAFSKISQKHLVGVMAGVYASYAIFMVFSKMSHLNYLWGVWPLGCFALAYYLVGIPPPEKEDAYGK